MNISQLIQQLQMVRAIYGDLPVQADDADHEINQVMVLDDKGREIHPRNPNGVPCDKGTTVFLEI